MSRIIRSRFTPDEDAMLRSIVQEFSTNNTKINWDYVSLRMKTKNVRQCKDRWFSYLKDGINTSPFTPQENYLLLSKVEEIGNHWKKIAKCFVERTDNAIKSQYKKLMRRHATKENVLDLCVDRVSSSDSQDSNDSDSFNSFEDDFNTFETDFDIHIDYDSFPEE